MALRGGCQLPTQLYTYHHTYRKFALMRLHTAPSETMTICQLDMTHRSGGAKGSYILYEYNTTNRYRSILTFFWFAVLISESRSNHSRTWLPAIPGTPSGSWRQRRGRRPTLVLHLKSRPATEDGDLGVVALLHQGAEHGAGRRAVRVPDYQLCQTPLNTGSEV